MDRLPVHTFPERGSFVVGEGVEEGFAEGDVRVHEEGFFVPAVAGVFVIIGRGVWMSFGAVVAAVVMAPGVARVLREGGGGGEGMSFARGF